MKQTMRKMMVMIMTIAMALTTAAIPAADSIDVNRFLYKNREDMR